MWGELGPDEYKQRLKTGSRALHVIWNTCKVAKGLMCNNQHRAPVALVTLLQVSFWKVSCISGANDTRGPLRNAWFHLTTEASTDRHTVLHKNQAADREVEQMERSKKYHVMF